MLSSKSKQQSAAPPFMTQNVAAEITLSLADGLINQHLMYSLWPTYGESNEQKETHAVVKIRNNRFEAAFAAGTAKPVKRVVKQS